MVDRQRAFNIAIGNESGGQQFGGAGSVAGVNEPTTSSAGAIGIAQVMPGTAPYAAELAGEEWNEWKYKNDSNYNYKLGLAYFEKQLDDFGGNLSKAYAAYNAGPGRTSVTINQYGDNWLANMPAETQEYVAKNIAIYNGGSNPSISVAETTVVEPVITSTSPQDFHTKVEDLWQRVLAAPRDIYGNITADAKERIMAEGATELNNDIVLHNATVDKTGVGKKFAYADVVVNNDDIGRKYNMFLGNNAQFSTVLAAYGQSPDHSAGTTSFVSGVQDHGTLPATPHHTESQDYVPSELVNTVSPTISDETPISGNKTHAEQPETLRYAQRPEHPPSWHTNEVSSTPVPSSAVAPETAQPSLTEEFSGTAEEERFETQARDNVVPMLLETLKDGVVDMDMLEQRLVHAHNFNWSIHLHNQDEANQQVLYANLGEAGKLVESVLKETNNKENLTSILQAYRDSNPEESALAKQFNGGGVDQIASAPDSTVRPAAPENNTTSPSFVPT